MLLTLQIPLRPSHAMRKQKIQRPVLPTADFDKAKSVTLAKVINLREYTFPLFSLNLAMVSVTIC